MNGSIVSGPDRIIVKPARPLADVRHRPNTPEIQTPEPVDVDVLSAYGITCSMSRRGHCYDNAVMEAFFSTSRASLANGSPAMPTRRPSCSTT